jgi:hypothetical protein
MRNRIQESYYSDNYEKERTKRDIADTISSTARTGMILGKRLLDKHLEAKRRASLTPAERSSEDKETLARKKEHQNQLRNKWKGHEKAGQKWRAGWAKNAYLAHRREHGNLVGLKEELQRRNELRSYIWG